MIPFGGYGEFVWNGYTSSKASPNPIIFFILRENKKGTLWKSPGLYRFQIYDKSLHKPKIISILCLVNKNLELL